MHRVHSKVSSLYITDCSEPQASSHSILPYYRDGMAALTNMLLLSAIAVSMSFPTTENEDVEKHAKMLKNPIIKPKTEPTPPFTVESIPTIVQFVKDNNKTKYVEEQGTTNEIYTITNIPTKEDDYKGNQNFPASDLKDNKILVTKNQESISFIELANKEDKNEKHYHEVNWPSEEKESSAIMEDQLAYTLINTKHNFSEGNKVIGVKKSVNHKSDHLENLRLLSKPQNIYVYAVGPALYPQSIYRREFSVPFYE